VTSPSTERPNFCTITSGLPAGCASFDHLLEVGVADELELLVRVVLHPLVGTGARRRDLTSVFGVPGREDECEGHGELVEELRIALREVESDFAGRVIDDNALVEIAALRRP
jgi:hypothetical protein